MSETTSKAPSSSSTIDITSLSFEQLVYLKKELEADLEYLAHSYAQLRSVSNKFMEAGECLNSITPESKDKEILIPLTSSVYVPGVLSNVSTVLVDIGTGYFIEKSIAEAKEYTRRKTQEIASTLEKVAASIELKRKNINAVDMVLQSKFIEAQRQTR